MFERFTERARKVMALANQEAQRFNHEHLGTEHILLGLVKEGSGVGPYALKNLGVDLHKVRVAVEKRIKAGPDMVSMGKLPQTEHSKKVLEHAVEEARNLSHNYIGTEHLLLGLLREGDGLAAKVLVADFGLKIENVRHEVLRLLGAGMDYPVDDISLAASLADAADDLADEFVEALLYNFTRRMERATTLYLTRHGGRLRVRFRAAGELCQEADLREALVTFAANPAATQAVTSRIKQMAGMDTNCPARPQEGAITEHDGQKLLLLVTTVPTDAGEVVVLRRQEI